MDTSILFEYGTVLLLLVILEGLLAADNAIVMAVMVKHLPDEQRKKALFYGLLGALVFRFIALFMIVWLATMWYIQLVGALYLLYIAFKHFNDKRKIEESSDSEEAKPVKKESGFWMTVLKVELADIAFAIDSMLAAVAVAITLPALTGYEDVMVGDMNVGPFAVMFIGGLIGVIIMRFAATWFVKVLQERPTLEDAAFIIVGWVGVKLLVIVACHDSVGLLPHDFAHSTLWKAIFWTVMVLVILIGWFGNPFKKKDVKAVNTSNTSNKRDNNTDFVGSLDNVVTDVKSDKNSDSVFTSTKHTYDDSSSGSYSSYGSSGDSGSSDSGSSD